MASIEEPKCVLDLTTLFSTKDIANTGKKNENVPDIRKGKKYLKEKIT